MSRPVITIAQLAHHVDQPVTLRGWVYNWRKKGKLRFVILRDGFGYLQCIVFRPEVDEEVWEKAVELTQESSIEISGRLVADERAPGGYELKVDQLKILDISPEFPIGKKDHGVDFLLNHRHLWLRSKRQHAIMRVRSEAQFAIRDFFQQRHYTLITDYFGEPAYLSQSGQLYLEPAVAAMGKVYCFGPTFRAEKSKTRRHLTEFWMVEPEVAWLQFDGLLDLCEEFLSSIISRILEECAVDLERLERDTSSLEPATKGAFPRLDYGDAVKTLQGLGHEIEFGDDFGGEHETILAGLHDRPVLVTRYPADIKAFYMQPDPTDPTRALAVDVLAPEGYGEIIGGSERSASLEHLERQIESHGLPREAFAWYLDVRTFGSFPHSGFGMGLERFVSWMCGIPHLLIGLARNESAPASRPLTRCSTSAWEVMKTIGTD